MLASRTPGSFHLEMTGPAPRGILVKARGFLKVHLNPWGEKHRQNPLLGKGVQERLVPLISSSCGFC